MSFFVGFAGARNLNFKWFKLVSNVVLSSVNAGATICTGCANGSDSFVRQVCPSAEVFSVKNVGFEGRGAWAVRTQQLVKFVFSAKRFGFVAFVNRPCPAAIFPSKSWKSGGNGSASGSWSAIALAIGLGIPVVVFWCSSEPVELPTWFGEWRSAGSGVWKRGFRFVCAF